MEAQTREHAQYHQLHEKVGGEAGEGGNVVFVTFHTEEQPHPTLIVLNRSSARAPDACSLQVCTRAGRTSEPDQHSVLTGHLAIRCICRVALP
jgi:hypothetical protein